MKIDDVCLCVCVCVCREGVVHMIRKVLCTWPVACVTCVVRGLALQQFKSVVSTDPHLCNCYHPSNHLSLHQARTVARTLRDHTQTAPLVSHEHPPCPAHHLASW